MGEGFFPVGGELALDEGGGAVRLLAGLPWSLSRSRVRLGAAAVLLVVPCRGRTAWRSGPVAPAQAHGPWTGARWPRVASGRPVSPSHSPARSAPRREAPASTIRRAPPRPCWTVRRTRGARQGGPLIGLDPDVPCAQQPVHGCSHRDAATAVGAPWWSARGHGRGSRPGVDHGEGRPPKACAAVAGRRRTPRGDLRGLFPLRGCTDRGRQVVADIAHRHARAYKLMIIESRPPGSALPPLRYPPRRRGRPPGTVGATGLEGPHLRGRRSWPLSRFLVLGRADGADPAPPAIPDDRSAQRPARVPGAALRAKRGAGHRSQ